ncbi:MAG: ankyrin repeat domain-containing protein [Capsulimonas sp.]|uniref:ankyrin repeat domain-containing protein n=1 Tax=Capsulimonas sp. TaxID=2494211 RepID=UPI00326753CE
MRALTFRNFCRALGLSRANSAYQKHLEEAIAERDLPRVKSALSNGADPNLPHTNPYQIHPTPLSQAVKAGRPDIVEALVKGGAHFHPRDPEFAVNLLFAAVWGGSMPMIQYLLDRGVPLPKESHALNLGMASVCGHTAVIAFLLDHGAAIDERSAYDGKTALMSAAMSGSADAVRLLLDHGADATLRSIANPDDPKEPSRSAFGYALHSHDIETIQLLIGTAPDLADPDALAYSSYSILKDERAPELLHLLLEYGADPNARGNGSTPLIRASKFASAECVALLLAHGADVNAKDDDGKTALDWSTDAAITQMLIQC